MMGEKNLPAPAGATLKFGIVAKTDPDTNRVRVRFDDQDGVETRWIPVLHPRTRTVWFCHLPEVGEHVACLMDAKLEDGVVIGALYSTPEPPPEDPTSHDPMDERMWGVWAKDGAIARYNGKRKEALINAPSDGIVIISVQDEPPSPAQSNRILMLAEWIEIRGDLVVVGGVNIKGAVTIIGDVSIIGNLVVEGIIWGAEVNETGT